MEISFLKSTCKLTAHCGELEGNWKIPYYWRQMTVDERLRQRLTGGLADMQIELAPAQLDLLLDYLQQLHKWNSVYNLTAVRDPHDMVARHLLDSLSLLPWVTGDSLIDVGTGAGLPGIPVAIARPDVAVTVLDSNGKKTRFLRHIQSHLRLGSVKVVQCRVEQFQPDNRFATVTSRAFASLSTFVTQCEHLCRPDGEIVAMLGKATNIGSEGLLGAQAFALEPVTVPGVEGVRHIARVRP